MSASCCFLPAAASLATPQGAVCTVEQTWAPLARWVSPRALGMEEDGAGVRRWGSSHRGDGWLWGAQPANWRLTGSSAQLWLQGIRSRPELAGNKLPPMCGSSPRHRNGP